MSSAFQRGTLYEWDDDVQESVLILIKARVCASVFLVFFFFLDMRSPNPEYVQRYATKEAADAATDGNDDDDQDEEMSDINIVNGISLCVHSVHACHLDPNGSVFTPCQTARITLEHTPLRSFNREFSFHGSFSSHPLLHSSLTVFQQTSSNAAHGTSNSGASYAFSGSNTGASIHGFFRWNDVRNSDPPPLDHHPCDILTPS